ncbi:hypothetical protein K488DRAFT_44212 [Vararia minispora EC-137]|uniref:Uncharacterized protein n=1 Tax=Vararia minispora EC-137 TaxID=1314806 RepID=A0ACB8QU69_9AGAM|nr:hypothetical protein K488DRAFT_44212 [Vararia minispora EC-137]
MTGLKEVIITPNPALRDHRRYPALDEDDEADFDEGDRALLNPEGGNSRWKEQPPSSVWVQAGYIALETFPTLLFTTVGTILTGELLEHVSRWKALTTVNELIMIIPVMLNLKGNLEMNLSARLGTAANMGHLDTPSTRRALILGNLALLQVQAALVSFVAACFSFLLGVLIPDETPAATNTPTTRAPRPAKVANPGHLDSAFNEFAVVASSTMTATCLSAALLGSFMCALIVLCRKLGRDPDNIAPPIASCLGDLVTLSLFGLCASVLATSSLPLVPILAVVLVVLCATACGVLVRRNEHVAGLLTQGWTPLFGAMVITSGSGIVLDMFVSRYEGYALLAVAFGGLPGGTGSIIVSRLSTALHAAAGTRGSTASLLPAKALESESSGARDASIAMLTLLAVSLPIEIFFLAALRLLGWLETPFGFFALALVFLSIAVAISLLAARVLTALLWRRALDPDLHALPIHSAAMDLSGQLLLVACFEVARLFGLKVTAKHRHRRRGKAR